MSRPESVLTSTGRFHSGGQRCAATVYRPAAATAEVPVIVMAHGFGCARRLRLPDYAARFAGAGYLVVLFDYRHFGDSDGEPRQLLEVAAQLQDWRAAIEWARTLDGVDPDRVVAWGTSFAGGHVITLAGTGSALTAIIAQVPHVSGVAAVRAAGVRQAARLLPAALQDVTRAALGRAPRYLDTVGPPGSRAVLATPDALPAMRRMAAADGCDLHDYPMTVAARIVLRIGLYSPIRYAPRVRCPALVQVADDDTVTPARSARRAAARMPHATVRSYRAGHFDVYVEPLFDLVVADQLAFLRAVAPVPR